MSFGDPVVPAPWAAWGRSAGGGSCRRRTKSLVTPTCGDCHWSSLRAAGRVAGAGPAPPRSRSGAACGRGVGRPAMGGSRVQPLALRMCVPCACHLLPRAFAASMSHGDLTLPVSVGTSSCPLLGSTALSPQPESGGWETLPQPGQSRAPCLTLGRWVPQHGSALALSGAGCFTEQNQLILGAGSGGSIGPSPARGWSWGLLTFPQPHRGGVECALRWCHGWDGEQTPRVWLRVLGRDSRELGPVPCAAPECWGVPWHQGLSGEQH